MGGLPDACNITPKPVEQHFETFNICRRISRKEERRETERTLKR